MTRRFIDVLALTGSALLWASSARAAAPGGGMALDQLDPAPAGDAFFGVPSPSAAGHLVPRALLMFDYAARPLTLSSGQTQSAIVSGQGFLHLNASFSLFDRVLISALFPIALLQRGDSPTIDGIAFTSPSTVEAGDLRLGARVRLFGDEGALLQVSAGAAAHLPTAPAGSFAGEGAFRLSPQLAFGGRISMLVWSAFVGGTVRASRNPSTLTYGVGAALSLFGDRLTLGAELFAATPLQEGFLQLSESRTIARSKSSNAELLFDARARLFGGFVAGVAAGPGLSDALGTPTFRVLGTLGFSPLASPADAQTKQEQESAPPDLDEDGVGNTEDACPYAFGVKSADRKRNGCPVQDGDEDGVPDADDACALQKGEASADPRRNGCPPDQDGDGVPDAIDACPASAGSAEANGCPR